MSFQQGLSGLNTSSKNLDVIGNNIANSGTYGSKVSRAEFGDIYAASLNGAGQNQTGIGSQLQTVAQQFTQGNITTTENPMDLAINGNGFFWLKDSASGGQQDYFSRNGQFKVDDEGYIVNNDGLRLQGFPIDAAGGASGTSGDLQLKSGQVPAQMTSKASLEFNLDSRAKFTAEEGVQGMDLNDSSTYNNTTSMTVYDAKGQQIAVTFYFQRAKTSEVDPNDPNGQLQDIWNVYATANGQPINADGSVPDGGNPTEPITQMVFGADGKIQSPTAPLGLIIPAGTSSLGYPTQQIGTVGDPTTGIQLDLTKVTESGSTFAVSAQSQDGYAPGSLTGIQVDKSGQILARYSNGQSKVTAQLRMATFGNVQGLQSLGGNVWASTSTSGAPVEGKAGNGQVGPIQAGALEESNVDITAELVAMVTAQRAYQANAQTIKTQDQVLQTIVNLR